RAARQRERAAVVDAAAKAAAASRVPAHRAARQRERAAVEDAAAGARDVSIANGQAGDHNRLAGVYSEDSEIGCAAALHSQQVRTGPVDVDVVGNEWQRRTKIDRAGDAAEIDINRPARGERIRFLNRRAQSANRTCCGTNSVAGIRIARIAVVIYREARWTTAEGRRDRVIRLNVGERVARN